MTIRIGSHALMRMCWTPSSTAIPNASSPRLDFHIGVAWREVAKTGP